MSRRIGEHLGQLLSQFGFLGKKHRTDARDFRRFLSYSFAAVSGNEHVNGFRHLEQRRYRAGGRRTKLHIVMISN